MKNKFKRRWAWASAAAQFGIILIIVDYFFHPSAAPFTLVALPALGYLWGCADQKKRIPEIGPPA